MSVLEYIGLGLTSGSSFLGAYATDKANQRNIALSREQMQWNSNEADKNRAFAQYMYDVNNRYNSPANQVRLLRDAGINPYLADVSSGTASSFPEGQQANPYTPAKVQPVNYMQGVPAAVLNAAQIANLNAQTAKVSSEGVGQDIANQYAHDRQIMGLLELKSRVADSNASAELKQSQMDSIDQQIKLINQSWDARVKSPEVQNQLAVAQTKQARESAALISAQKITEDSLRSAKVKLSKAQTASLAQGINESVQRISNMKAEKDLTNKQVDTEIQKAAEIHARAIGLRNDNKAWPWMVKRIKSEIYRNFRTNLRVGPIDAPFLPEDVTNWLNDN